MMFGKHPLSFRNVEYLLADPGINTCHETVRLWWDRFGPILAAEIRKKRLRRRRAFTRWRRHVDEVCVRSIATCPPRGWPWTRRARC